MQEISKELIIKASNGDVDAFESIYRATASYVYTISYRVLGSKEEAEEVTQDVFMSVHRNLGKFRFRSTFKTWIYRITLNKAINSYRKLSRKRKRNVPFDESIDPEHNVTSGNEKFEREHNETLVKGMMAELAPEQRACLLLKEIEGMKYEEISRVLGVKLNTVRTRIKRAREKLLDKYGKRSVEQEVREG